MDLILRVWGEDWELCDWSTDSAGRDEPVSTDESYEALREALRDPLHCTRVRHALARDRGGIADVSRMTDDEFLDYLGNRLYAGALVFWPAQQVARRPAPAAPGPAPAKPAIPAQPVPKPATPTQPKEEPVEWKLVELVEVVEHKGKQTTQAPAARKQYINLGKDIDDKKARPEYGEYVALKARIEWTGGDKSRSLAGKPVYFYVKPGGKNKKDLDAVHRAGIGARGDDKKQLSADAKGWTDVIHCYLSKHGGEEFEFFATDSAGYKGGLGAGAYTVWRKLWFQMTHADDFAVPDPAASVAAYQRVFVELEKAESHKFKKADAPAHTYYPEYMVKAKAGDKEVALIGAHNKDHFRGLFKAEADKPLKAHLVVCEYQWDPEGATDKVTINLKKNPSGPIAMSRSIVKPALDGDLVITGTWSTTSGPAASGDLTEDNIVIEKARTKTTHVKVRLPADAPVPTAAKPIRVELVLNGAAGYLGESSSFQIIAVYDATDEPDYNDTVTHEIGHSVNQTPEHGGQPKGMANHPKQYIKHGGIGPHCSEGAGTHPTAKDEDGNAEFTSGKCVMFHSGSNKCIHRYCDICEPYLRLQDMSAWK